MHKEFLRNNCSKINALHRKINNTHNSLCLQRSTHNKNKSQTADPPLTKSHRPTSTIKEPKNQKRWLAAHIQRTSNQEARIYYILKPHLISLPKQRKLLKTHSSCGIIFIPFPCVEIPTWLCGCILKRIISTSAKKINKEPTHFPHTRTIPNNWLKQTAENSGLFVVVWLGVCVCVSLWWEWKSDWQNCLCLCGGHKRKKGSVRGVSLGKMCGNPLMVTQEPTDNARSNHAELVVIIANKFIADDLIQGLLRK